MSDHLRFRVVSTSADEAFKRFFGARQVLFAFRLADAWVRWRSVRVARAVNDNGDKVQRPTQSVGSVSGT
jgi:hypothetical protein